jgi:hypothetical protein
MIHMQTKNKGHGESAKNIYTYTYMVDGAFL